ncbi:MAG TPA: hypothetical protein DEA38_00040 [Stenotrophomonas sp.]|nr:hypothetical protein [Stenotrophomonas sp.]
MAGSLFSAVLKLIWPFPVQEEGEEGGAADANLAFTPRVHVISDFGDAHHLAANEATPQTIRDALQSVDWVHGFHQVVVVVEPGVSMEVGGSLDPQHGLSAMYENHAEGVQAVIIDPPSSVDEMQDILLSFIEGGDTWKNEYAFQFHGGAADVGSSTRW